MFEILQHTADVRLRVRAPSLEELFRDAMRGMFAIMRAELGARRSELGVRADIVIDSVDLTALLVDFLNAVLTRAQIDHVAFEDVNFVRLTQTGLDAQLSGVPAQFEQDIKAVTYHEAEVRHVEGAWQTMLVFDI
ncbi:MAG TPA: archease [Thermoanaerobaculia bacterium]|nr:archease [Thermoanaerobaculia bacterium]